MKSFKSLSEAFALLVKVVIIMLLCIIGISCGITELGSEDVGGTGIWVDKNDQNGNPDLGGSGQAMSNSCYMTAVEYPENYDWVSDLEKGSVKCSLVVYVDGKSRMKVAVGNAYQISSDADMHRLIDGNLYTDYSTDKETIIKKNGVEICRWNGREVIKGMAVVDGDLYTIGNMRRGNGFTYRKNGEIIFEKDDGYVYEHLTCGPDNMMYFSFCELIRSQYSVLERYYVVRNGIPEQIAIRDDILRVWDVAIHGTSACYVASLKGSDDLLLGVGNRHYMLDLPIGTVVVNVRIITSVDSIYVEAVLKSADRTFFSVVWRNESLEHIFMPGKTVTSFVECGHNGICWALNPFNKMEVSLICRGNEIEQMPFGYLISNSRASAYVNGILYVGLTSTIGERPAIWKDGMLEKMNFNGIITSVQSVSTLP